MSTILIVEDNPRNMKLVRDVLQVKGHATLEATNAEDGIVLARDRPVRKRRRNRMAYRRFRTTV